MKQAPQYAGAVHADERPDYSKEKSSDQRNWKCRIISKMCLLCCNWLAIIFYVIIFVLGLRINSIDVYQDLSIYSQAVDDWRTPMWSSFDWSTSESCPDGTVSIGNEWLGTVEGNKTSDSVYPTSEAFSGDIEPVAPVIQDRMFKYNTAILCGSLQEDKTYEKAIRINVPADGAPECPQDTIACSTNAELGGTTVCVKKAADCPVTDLVVYLKGSTQEASYRDDSNYSVSCTAQSAGTTILCLAQATRTNKRSNSPLRNIFWQSGQPCAYSEQRPVVLTGQKAPKYYPLEVLDVVEECQDYLYSELHDSNGAPIVDTRYSNLFLGSEADMPNEYDLQQMSGVLDQLNQMHLFSQYVPDAKTTKSDTLYQLWGRPVIQFSSECDRDIEAAGDSLVEVQRVDADTRSRNSSIIVICAIFGGIQLIWMIINTMCFCCTRKNQEGHCYHINLFMHAGMFLGLIIAPMILIPLSKSAIESKHAALTDWAQYAECMDDLMKISDDQYDVLDDILSLARTQLALICIILMIQVVTLISYFIIYCRRDKDGCCCCKAK